MKNILKFLGIIALTAVIGFSFIACGGDDLVVLAPGSQGIAGDGQIDGLSSGSRYIIQIGNDFFGIRGNGTIHFGAGTMEEAIEQALDGTGLQAGVYSIFYLENGTTYNVFMVFPPITNDDTIGGIGADIYAYGKNAIIDASDTATGWELDEIVEIVRGAGRETNDTTIIFFYGEKVVIAGDEENINELLWDADEEDFVDEVTVLFADDVFFEISAGIDGGILDEFQPRGARVVARDGDTYFSITGLGIFNEITILKDDL
jgi:hypothetical protein